MQKNIFASISLPQLQMLAATVREIYDAFAIRGVSHVTVSSFEDDPLRNCHARNEAIEFLVRRKLVEVSAEKHRNSYSRWDIKIVNQKALRECVKLLKTVTIPTVRRTTVAMPPVQQKIAVMPCDQPKDGSSVTPETQRKVTSQTVIRIPSRTRWNEIEIEFKDEESIRVKAGKFRSVPYHYAQLGFTDKKTSGPNKQWKLLQELAKYEGKLGWVDSEATKARKKQVSLLSLSLQKCFGINESFFYPYRQQQTYRTKLKSIAYAE